MTLLLIGPMGVGKSTTAKLLSERLSLPVVDIDVLRWGAFAKMPGFDEALVESFFTNNEGEKAFAYMKPFEAKLVEEVLAEKEEAVYDFGAGYTVYDDPALFGRVQAAFAPYANVIHLRYSSDTAESLAALFQRHDIPETLYYALNRPFIERPCNGILARHTVDTKGKSPERIADEILAAVM